MADSLWTKVDNCRNCSRNRNTIGWCPLCGYDRTKDPTARFPPREFQPGPPPGQDYFTLTAQHGRPYGRFEQRGGR